MEKRFPEFALELLGTVRTDGKKFVDEVCYTVSGNNRFASIPVLASIAPKEFVAAWMESPKENWYWISRALVERYSGAHIREVLEAESTWSREVVRLLNQEAEKASGLAKLRIQWTIPNFPHLDAVDAEGAADS